MIRHAINRDQFLFSLPDNSADVFLQFLFALESNHTGACGHRENDVNVDLRVGVGHSEGGYVPLLTELIRQLITQL